MIKILHIKTRFLKQTTPIINLRNVSYVQGQSPEPKIREYFYYIDHQGMVRILKLGLFWLFKNMLKTVPSTR